jgi:hypothetical protein
LTENRGSPRRRWTRNVLLALAVAAGGFVLLNLTFLLDFLFQSALRPVFSVFRPSILEGGPGWSGPWLHVLFFLLIGLISWFVYRSKLPVLIKAIYTVVPTAVTLATVGILLYQWPAAVWITGILITTTTLALLYVKKQPWLYFFAVSLTAAPLAIAMLLGVDI